MRSILIGGLLLVVAGCSGGAERPAEAKEKQEVGDAGVEIKADDPHLSFVKIEAVGESSDAPLIVLTGKVTYDENHTQRVASPVDGRATKVLVELGEKVGVGQSLIELSSPNIAQLQADTSKAAHDLNLAKKAFERAKKLREDGAISEKDFAQAENDLAKAEADVTNTAGRLRSLNLAASGSGGASVRSQIAGTIVERTLLVGQEVRADQAAPLLTITDLDNVWVVADVYEQDLSLIRPGVPVKVSVASCPGKEFDAQVDKVSNVVDPTSHTLKLRCIAPNPEGKLKPEMFARIVLHDDGEKRITIPTRAVLAETQPPRVVMVDGTNFRFRDVEVGPEVDGRVRVLSGLKLGERIVTDGAIFLKQEILNQ